MNNIINSKKVSIAPNQSSLWFHEKYEPNTATYNISLGFKIDGTINYDFLKQSIQQIINRHESLRTYFVEVDGEPKQLIYTSYLYTLPIIDFKKSNKKEIESFIQRQICKPFNINKAPLFRALLIQKNNNEHIFLWSMHHIISDGWSMQILCDELSTFYNALIAGVNPTYPEIKYQYSDYTKRYMEWLQEDDAKVQIDYWKNELSGEITFLNIPTDYSRPKKKTFQGDIVSFDIPKEIEEKLIELSKQENASLFMTLTAAYNVLLYRYTGQEEILIGTPFLGRTHPELDRLIGFFVNTLVLKTEMTEQLSFIELVEKVRDNIFDALSHSDIPFENLVTELKPTRDPSYSTLVQTMIVMENTPVLELEGTKTSPINLHDGTSKYDLTLFLDIENGMRFTFEYNTDLYKKETIISMGNHFCNLLKGITENPEQKISYLPLITLQEKEKLLVKWNDTATISSKALIHELFEKQVEKTPDNIAVIFEDQKMTYQELNERANQLARYLKKKGIGLEDHIGICIERSFELVIAILGTLKVGAAYVPIDPDLPLERISFMTQDADLKLLLTQTFLKSKIQTEIDTVSLDEEHETLSKEFSDNLLNEGNQENLAYIIYTSGSTGKPKGVCISHRSLVNHMLWMKKEFPLNEDDKVFQKTPFSFDASVWEFYAPLLAGAQLVLASQNGHQDPKYIVESIIHENITVLQLVPSFLNILLDEEGINQCVSLKYVFCGGEILQANLIMKFYEKLRCATLYNLYGLSETTIDVTFWCCKKEENIVSIGRPIPNVQIYVLDSSLNPVPIGVIGELYVGGAALAREYLNLPNLTREKFISNPFDRKEKERLFKTGDLVRYLSNGNLEFVGRNDDQIKLRGMRIELGEIESIIQSFSNVQEAVVLIKGKSTIKQHLVAYITQISDKTIELSMLKDYLKIKLPNYMIPQQFLILEKMPLTNSGKINKKVLSELKIDILEENYVAPRNAVEEKLAEILSKLLDHPKISILDNFFEIGGHSLLAMQFVSRISNMYSIRFPISIIFEFPTIKEISEIIQSTDSERSSKMGVKIIPRKIIKRSRKN